jgi:hypothetical protein
MPKWKSRNRAIIERRELVFAAACEIGDRVAGGARGVGGGERPGAAGWCVVMAAMVRPVDAARRMPGAVLHLR